MHLLVAALLAVAPPAAPLATASPVASPAPGTTITWPDGGSGPSPTFVLTGSGSLAAVASALNGAGFTVVRFDDPNPSRAAAVAATSAAVAAARTDPHVDPDRIYVLGAGNGAEPALATALTGAPVRGVVLVSPEFSAGATANAHAAIGNAGAELAAMRVPVLLLRGANDGSIAPADLKAFFASAHDAQRSLQYGELAGDDQLAIAPFDPRATAAIIAWLSEIAP
jgi:pimeloyl-ACP methyl ester carboxylesterase